MCSFKGEKNEICTTIEKLFLKKQFLNIEIQHKNFSQCYCSYVYLAKTELSL